MSSSLIDDRLDGLTMNFQDESKEEICNRIEQCLQKHTIAEELFDLDKRYKY